MDTGAFFLSKLTCFLLFTHCVLYCFNQITRTIKIKYHHCHAPSYLNPPSFVLLTSKGIILQHSESWLVIVWLFPQPCASTLTSGDSTVPHSYTTKQWVGFRGQNPSTHCWKLSIFIVTWHSPLSSLAYMGARAIHHQKYHTPLTKIVLFWEDPSKPTIFLRNHRHDKHLSSMILYAGWKSKNRWSSAETPPPKNTFRWCENGLRCHKVWSLAMVF